MYKQVTTTYKIKKNGKTQFINIITIVLIYQKGYINKLLSMYSIWSKIFK
jgi:hypothetical protein